MNQKTQMAKKVKKCKHCNNELRELYFNSDFCCNGCKQVFELISENGLNQYYKYRDINNYKEFQSVNYAERTFDYLDSGDFKNKNVRKIEFNGRSVALISFYLTGVQCPACVWLIEKLPSFSKGVLKAELNFRTCIAKIHYDPERVKLSEVAVSLNRLGYLPKPYHPKTEDNLKKEAKKLLMLQLGVAGFCAGNTMLLAVSLYQGYFSGMAYNYKTFIHFISLLLTLPVISFSAEPFFKAAVASLKIKRLHIDVPISIGIILAFLFSSYNLFVGDDHVYFDSICMLVFLLLIGRFLQKTAIDKVFNNSVEDYLLPNFGRVVIKDGNLIEKDIKRIEAGEELLIYKDEVIPVDGEVVESESTVSNAFLTGESKPINVFSGSQVFAGANNLSQELRVVANKDYYSSRIFKLISVVNETKVENTVANNIFTNIFVATVFGLSLFCLSYWIFKGELEFGIINTISLLIITCPCALGLARPLVVAKVANEFAKKDIFIKNEKFFDLFSKVKDIYFDKTGTLTNGLFAVKEFYLRDKVKLKDLIGKICFLEEQTEHPIKNAFLKLNKGKYEQYKLLNFDVFQGLGVRGTFSDGQTLCLGSKKFLDKNSIIRDSFYKNQVHLVSRIENTVVFAFDENRLLATFIVADTLRDGMVSFINDLRLTKKIYIVSGDNQEVVGTVGAALGLKDDVLYSNLLPQDKVEIINANKSITCMFGDGANDAQALKKASLSVGVGGSSEVNLLVADIFISRPSTMKFKYLFSGIKAAKMVVYRNIGFSLLYNIFGAYLAFFGFINPLLAAILMPISSFTVILSSFLYRLR